MPISILNKISGLETKYQNRVGSAEDSLVESEKKIQDLEAQGIRPIKVEVDVEALLTWCTTQGLAVTPETRTKFMMSTLRDYVREGIVKP